MDPAALASILGPLGIYALAVPTPGPGLLVITQASVAHGRAHGAAAALGTSASVSIYAVASALGIAALMTALPWLSGAIQIAGGAYLLWMGTALLKRSIRRDRSVAGPGRGAAAPTEGPAASFRRALLVGLANPKMAAFFLGLLAPAMGGDHSLTTRLLVLSGIVVIDLIYHQAVAWIAGKGRAAVGGLGRWFGVAVGGSMITFGGIMIAKAFERP